MIKILGFRRIVTLAILLGLNIVFGMAAYMHFIPQKVMKERELNGMRGQVSTLTGDIDGLRVELAQLDVQVSQYETLKEGGFFDGQSRRKAELILQEIQEKSGVISAVASIAGGAFEESEHAGKADHQILKSPITVKIDAVNDLDVFRYIYLMEKFFPGHVSVENVIINREADITGVVLRAIASSQNPELVTAELQLAWRTMIPKDDTNNTGAQ